MNAYDALCLAAEVEHLKVVGTFHPAPEDGAPESTGTMALLAPGPGFWAAFLESPEGQDGQPDPIDRWSTRVITGLADLLGAEPLFPFGGPPYQPFISWAHKTGRIHQSPVTLLVHDAQGLMISFRGALALREVLDLPPPPLTPCLLCDAPCESACPVDALSEDAYDLEACHTFLDTEAGQDCLQNGCKARRVCPVSQGASRHPDQSAHHMAYFHPAKGNGP